MKPALVYLRRNWKLLASLALGALAGINSQWHLVDPHTCANVAMIAAALGIGLNHSPRELPTFKGE